MCEEEKEEVEMEVKKDAQLHPKSLINLDITDLKKLKGYRHIQIKKKERCNDD